MSEMSLEERALRHADEFFTDRHTWWRSGDEHPKMGATCVGLLLNRYRRDEGLAVDGFEWAGEVMDVSGIISWNDGLPSFKAMKLALKARIRHYKGMRR